MHYHLGKLNVVADALSQKSQGVLAGIAFLGMVDTQDCGTVQAILQGSGLGHFGILVAMPSLLSKVIESQ